MAFAHAPLRPVGPGAVPRFPNYVCAICGRQGITGYVQSASGRWLCASFGACDRRLSSRYGRARAVQVNDMHRADGLGA